MIQLNLLPDIKLDYIKANRTKHMVLVVSAIVAASAFTIFLLMFISVKVFQKQHIDHLTTDIKSNNAKIQNINDISKILTVQNQLKALPDLHSQKPATSRLPEYLIQITPSNVSLASVNIDFTSQTVSMSGSAPSLSDVNTFVDTIKFTNYTVKGTEGSSKAFSDVVLTGFSKDQKGASYQIDFKFDAAIFDNTKEVSLSIPKIITTRSEIEKPSALFNQTGTGQ